MPQSHDDARNRDGLSGNTSGDPDDGIEPHEDTDHLDELNALHVAVRLGDLDAIESLLAGGADVNKSLPGGLTPLHWAIKWGQTSLIKVLVVNWHADIESRTEFEETPLHYAARMNCPDAIEALVAAGADINALLPEGASCMHIAARHNAIEAIHALAALGVAINPCDDYGATPLHDVSRHHRGDVECVEALLAAKADVAAKNDKGITALHYAAGNPSVTKIRALILGGADIKAEDAKGRTPLHWAAESGYTDVVVTMIGAGANINARDKNGDTPLDLAENRVTGYSQGTSSALLAAKAERGDRHKREEAGRQRD